MPYLSSIWVKSDLLIPNPSSEYVQLVLNPHQPHCTTLVLQLFYLGWIEIGSDISSKIHLGIISFTSEASWFKRKNKVIYIQSTHSINHCIFVHHGFVQKSLDRTWKWQKQKRQIASFQSSHREKTIIKKRWFKVHVSQNSGCTRGPKTY